MKQLVSQIIPTICLGAKACKLPIVILLLPLPSCALESFEIPFVQNKVGQVVVFDIDGTLTPSQPAIFSVREGAAKSAKLYSDNGYKILYLSARIKLFQSRIPSWLKSNGFPEGNIQVPKSSEESNDHAYFKTKILSEFKSKGWELFAAYGDSSTDFIAYKNVGIPKERVFAVKREGGESCQTGTWSKCFESWNEHLEQIEKLILD